MSCADVTALQDIAACAFQMSMGGGIIAGIIVFVLMLYGMYKMRIPFIVQVPVGLFILYVFAGAGMAPTQPFSSLMLIAIMFFGAIIALLIWKFKR